MKIFYKIFLVLSFLFVAESIFAATMDSRVRRVPAKLTERLFSEPTYDDIAALSKNLSSGLSGTMAKVKVFHDWICDNIAYDTDLFTVGVGSQDPLTVLKKRAGVCVGYANLMLSLCYFVNIEAPVITGWSKGFGYRGKLKEKSDHAWNAIKVGSKWQLIDVTWDAGYVSYKTFIKRYSTDWLNLSAEQFIYSHLPEDEEKQFLPKQKIRSKEDFEREPYVPARFFVRGFGITKNSPNYTNEISGETEFEFSIPKNTDLTSALYNSNGRIVKYSTWIDKKGNKINYALDVPNQGEFKAKLFAQKSSKKQVSDYIPISKYEKQILPKVDSLVAEKKISKTEAELFISSYYKVAENECYYFREDLFDTKRNAAVEKVLEKANVDINNFEEVISFEVYATEGYAGYGSDSNRFPIPYQLLREVNGVRPVFPRNGSVVRGETVLFSVDAPSFSSVGFVVNGNLTPCKRNPKTGFFEIEYTIPDGVDTVSFFVSKDKSKYTALWGYTVVDSK